MFKNVNVTSESSLEYSRMTKSVYVEIDILHLTIYNGVTSCLNNAGEKWNNCIYI